MNTIPGNEIRYAQFMSILYQKCLLSLVQTIFNVIMNNIYSILFYIFSLIDKTASLCIHFNQNANIFAKNMRKMQKPYHAGGVEALLRAPAMSFCKKRSSPHQHSTDFTKSAREPEQSLRSTTYRDLFQNRPEKDIHLPPVFLSSGYGRRVLCHSCAHIRTGEYPYGYPSFLP